MAITKTSFQDIIERIHTIPSLPEVVTQVVRLVNDPKSSAEDISAIMIKDPGMVAKILRLVNSVFYGLSEPVHDLDQAIPILGFKTIRSIALSISVINAFQAKEAGFNMKAFWTHSAVCATIGRVLAVKARLPDPELSFVIGLLKDIGMLLLVEWLPEEARAIVALAREYKLSFQAAARKLMESDQCELAAWLCERWGLEPAIVNGVRHQYDLAGSPDQKLTSTILFSEYLCALKAIRVAGQCDDPKLDQQVWTFLGFDRSSLVEVLTHINDEVDKARQLLELVRG